MDRFVSRSTSLDTADVNPLVLREGDTRLVFLPTLVNNTKDAAASLAGAFAFQRKGRRDNWENADAINLNTLKAGDGVKLVLKSGELLTLYRMLQQLYEISDTHGVKSGRREFVSFRLGDDGSSFDPDGLTAFGNEDANSLIRAFFSWLSSRQTADLLHQMEGVAPAELMNFDAAVGAARLAGFLQDYDDNYHRTDERYWQSLLKKHAWAIGQIYAQPIILVDREVYVGGRKHTNNKGNAVDFLYKNALTENSFLVEIKTPHKELVQSGEYRNNTFAAGEHVVGGVQQLLMDRCWLSEQWRTLVDEDEPEFRVHSPRALLIVGDSKTLTTAHRRRSFELYRGEMATVDIVTFDELYDRVKSLVNLLVSA